MPRTCPRLLLVLVAALASILAPLSTNVALDARRGDCCEHATHAAPHCPDCIVCVTGLSCVLPDITAGLTDSGAVIACLPWQTFTAETRTDPPPLPPPRPAAGLIEFFSSNQNQNKIIS